MKLRTLLGVAVIGALGVVAAGAITNSGAASTPTQYFTGFQTSESGPQTVIAAGPIAAKGTDIETGQTTDQFRFPKGSLMLTHRARSTSQHHDPRTCSFVFLQTGTYVITSGTGAYKHASGSGTYRIHGIGTQCKKKGATELGITVELQGPLTVG